MLRRAPQWQRLARPARSVTFDKGIKPNRRFVVGKAPRQFVRDLFRHVARPTLHSVEGDDANRVGILTGHQVADYRCAVGALFVGFRPGAAKVRADTNVSRRGGGERRGTTYTQLQTVFF